MSWSMESKGPAISTYQIKFPAIIKAHWQPSHVHHSAARIPEKLQQVQRLNQNEAISQRFHFPVPQKKYKNN